MKKLFCFLLVVYVLIAPCLQVNAQSDLLDTLFQPSKNLDQIITIGNSKNAVGNEVFRGSSTVDGQIGIIKECFKILGVQKDACKQGAFWEDQKCYQVPALNEVNESVCNSQGGEWRVLSYIDTSFREPLLVRITKTLLRITIALGIPMIIFTGVKTIISAINGGEYKNDLQQVVIILVGLLLALSAIGIIYFIQSITLHSLSSSPINL